MTTPLYQAARLAIRDEGEWIVAYYALPHTMDGAIEVSRLSSGIADEDGAVVFQAWKGALGEWISRMLERVTGIKVTHLDEVPPPGHERIQ